MVKLPPGSSLEGSDDVMQQIEAEVKTAAGNPRPADDGRAPTSGARWIADRSSSSWSIPSSASNRRRNSCSWRASGSRSFANCTIGVQLPALIQGAGSTAELQFFLQGPDLQQLEKYAARI